MDEYKKAIRTQANPRCYWSWAHGRIETPNFYTCEMKNEHFFRERENRGKVQLVHCIRPTQQKSPTVKAGLQEVTDAPPFEPRDFKYSNYSRTVAGSCKLFHSRALRLGVRKYSHTVTLSPTLLTVPTLRIVIAQPLALSRAITDGRAVMP